MYYIAYVMSYDSIYDNAYVTSHDSMYYIAYVMSYDSMYDKNIRDVIWSKCHKAYMYVMSYVMAQCMTKHV